MRFGSMLPRAGRVLFLFFRACSSFSFTSAPGDDTISKLRTFFFSMYALPTTPPFLLWYITLPAMEMRSSASPSRLPPTISIDDVLSSCLRRTITTISAVPSASS